MKLWQLNLVLVCLTLCPRTRARAQCPEWSSTFHAPGISGEVLALASFDDGAGPALFVGGEFAFAAGVPASNVARWNGVAWSAVGAGFDDLVRVLTVFDDGTGPALFAGGEFDASGSTALPRIARWSGTAWTPLAGGGAGAGAGGHVRALVAFDDGSGPALYAGGSFGCAGGTCSYGIARWTAAGWSNVGVAPPDAYALAVHDDGAGPALYAATKPDDLIYLHQVWRWDGTAWNQIGETNDGASSFQALATFDDGGGPALYLGGDFTSISGVSALNVAKWDGASWSAAGTGVGISVNSVNDLFEHDDGTGAALYATGSFSSAGGQPAHGIARWDGVAWTDIGGGVLGIGDVLASFDDGSGEKLVLGGEFWSAGNVAAASLATWDGAAWAPLSSGGLGVSGPDFLGTSNAVSVDVLASIDLGTGPALYAGGNFSNIGITAARGIARLDGTSWSALGSGANNRVQALASFDDGSGAALYAGGLFTGAGGNPAYGIAKWNGSQWSAIGGLAGPFGAGSCATLALFDDGGGAALFVGGSFTSAGGVSAPNVAKWDGASWHALGTGTNAPVLGLVAHDDGSGPALFAVGSFTSAGGAPASYVAKWNGAQWSALGSGLNYVALCAAAYDDGSGPALYVGGRFSQAGGSSALRVARWNGANWSPLGSGLGHPNLAIGSDVNALLSHDDGSGPALFAGGIFLDAGAIATRRIAKWDGASWSSLSTGLGPPASMCRTLAAHQDGLAPHGSLYAGGTFTRAGGIESLCIARWSDACICQAASYCTSGTTSNGCVPTISGSGTPSASAPSGFTISTSGVEGAKQGHIFYGLSGPNAAPWGASSHFLCVKAPSQRTGTQDSGGTAGACDGAIALDWNTYVATHPASLGVPFSAGTSVWAQLFFRDPPGPKTTALSNGLTFTVCP